MNKVLISIMKLLEFSNSYYLLPKSYSPSLRYLIIIIPYPRERRPMGGAPNIGPRLGGGPIFEVSVAHLDAKERPGKLPMLSS